LQESDIRYRVGLVVVGAHDLIGGGGAERYFADLFINWQRHPAPICALTLITDEITVSALGRVGRKITGENVLILPAPGPMRVFTQGWTLLRVARAAKLDLIHISLVLPRHLIWLWLLRSMRHASRPRITVNINDARLAHTFLAKETTIDRPAWAERWTYDAYFRTAPVDGVMSWYKLFNERFASRYDSVPILHSAKYCFVDSERFKPAKKKSDYVVFVSRMVASKQPRLFVLAVADARRRAPDIINRWRFTLYGRGPLESEIREEISKQGLEDILEFRDPSTLEDTLAVAKVFVSTQDLENFTSLSMLEAMACGNAVVARNVGQTRQFLRPGVNGILAPACDKVPAFSIALLETLAATNRHAEWGEASRRITLKEHCVKNVVAEFDEFWARVIAQR
jgi:glycosyltransferase involved in cell wall biosynthesis